jgi:hypothetical protein
LHNKSLIIEFLNPRFKSDIWIQACFGLASSYFYLNARSLSVYRPIQDALIMR